MKPIAKKPLKPASARPAPKKALPPRAAPAQKPARADKAKPAAVVPAPVPEAAPAATSAPRATLRTLAQAVVDAFQPDEGGWDIGGSRRAAIDSLAAFLAAAPKGERKGRTMTDTQRTLIELCQRPQGATAGELAAAVGWPSIAARSTMTKIADRFGYAMSEKPKANGRGITFYLGAKA